MELMLLSLIVVLLIAVLSLQLRKPSSLSEGPGIEEVVAKMEQLRGSHDQQAAVLSKELALTRQEAATHARDGRTETVSMLNQGNASLLNGLNLLGQSQNDRLQSFSETITALTSANDTKFESIRTTMETKLKELRDDNALRLEEMRRTVDEKLQGTLEKRLGESFKQVSERLEQVHRGLGEMQNLATGVGDLKKVLTNVKTRGGWGEVQLGALLEQMLTSAQYEKNVKTNPSSGEIVEYAIKLPGKGEDDSVVWLPVDAKFFIEDFKRLHDAQERADLAAIEESTKALRDAVLKCAKDISTKYLNPPHTTDFGIMFVPTEGLFAEIIRIPGVIQDLQGKHRVVLAGPTTFAALLNSLQMGFKTLTIQKQSSEVWKTLSDVKAEFAKFGVSLDAVKKKLLEATNKIETVGTRSRALERSLRNVESLPGEVQGPSLEIEDLLKIEESELIAPDERE
jgi:DNA recombination protein RmuC